MLGVVHLSFGKITQWQHNYLAEICSKGKKLQNRSTSWEKRELVTEVCSHHPFFSIHFKQEDLGSDSDSIHIISLQVLFPFENRAICNHKSRTR